VMFSNHVGWESSWKIVRVLDIFSVLCCEQLLEGLARSACRIFNTELLRVTIAFAYPLGKQVATSLITQSAQVRPTHEIKD
jgi:hypothetical protein